MHCSGCTRRLQTHELDVHKLQPLRQVQTARQFPTLRSRSTHVSLLSTPNPLISPSQTIKLTLPSSGFCKLSQTYSTSNSKKNEEQRTILQIPIHSSTLNPSNTQRLTRTPRRLPRAKLPPRRLQHLPRWPRRQERSRLLGRWQGNQRQVAHVEERPKEIQAHAGWCGEEEDVEFTSELESLMGVSLVQELRMETGM
jgi:hypothetical protein